MKRVKYNGEFKTIDTQEKAYVLGLYYSDGYVAKSERFTGISLHIQDAKILYKIEELFPFLYTSIDRTKANVVSLRCNQIAYCSDLIANGVLPRKSYENRLSLSMPNINKELIPHFIRGFFDGDGSVYFNKGNSKNSKVCTFTGVCHNLLFAIRDVLTQEGIVFRYTIYDVSNTTSVCKGRVIKGCAYIMNLILSNKLGIDRFYNYLYENSTIHFTRKNTIMATWVDRLSPRTSCRICGSTNTIYAGADKILCKVCDRHMNLNGTVLIKMDSKPCKHCGSRKTVGNSKTRSKIDGSVISQVFLCRDCNRNSSYSIQTAPLESNL